MNQTLDGRNKQIRYYYQCSNHRKKVCKTKSINAAYIENAVLDVVVDVINNSNMNLECLKQINQLISFERGIMAKNKHQLSLCNKQLDTYMAKSLNPTNPPFMVNAIERRIEEIAQDIEQYSNAVKIQAEHIDSLSKISAFTLSKEELLQNRIVTRGIIKEIVKEIVYDDVTDEYEIILV